jgi:8-oxo-dGTP diphosphatase
MTLKPFTPDEARVFYDALPRKICMAGVVVVNDAGQVLLVKPSYKDGWLVPGGAVDAFESPRAGAAREATEEIGDCVDLHRLLVVNFETAKTYADKGDVLNFLFLARLRPGAKVCVDGQEITDAQWVDFDTAKTMLEPMLGDCMDKVRTAVLGNTTLYLEDGKNDE